MNWTSELALGYLAAMIDGEGWVGKYKGAPQNRAIRIANTDEELIAALQGCLEFLGVKYNVVRFNGRSRPEHWAKSVLVDITGYENLKYVLDNVPIRATRKRERLEGLVNSFTYKPIKEVELRRLYVEEGMTDVQVAQAMGVGKKRIINARRKYGIAGHSHEERAPLIWAKRRERYGDKGRRS